MRLPSDHPASARCASAALATLATLAAVQLAGASGLRAQQGGAPTTRLPRLLDGGAGAAGRPEAWAGHAGWSGATANGWSTDRPAGASGHGGARRLPRRVQPLIVFVSPYASVYATSSGGCGWIGAASCSAPPAAVDADSTARRAVRTKVIEVPPAASTAPAALAAPVAVDWLRDDVLRLRWSGGDPTVREVELVIADSARRVLASQRVHAAPYTAVFARDARTAFVGVGVLRADGTSTLTLTPLGRRPQSRE